MKQNQDLEAARTENPKITQFSKLNMPQSQKILLIGDTQTGKSTFASLFTRMGYSKFLCTQNVTEMENSGRINKAGKTIGCDIFVGIRSYEQQKQQANTKNGSFQAMSGQACYKLFDLTGDKTQRNYLDIYLARVHSSLNTIFFFFDVTNLRTLSHFKKWITILLNKQTPQQDESLTNSHENNHSNTSNNITISEEQDSFISYETFKGIPAETLANLQIFLIGTKIDNLPEAQHQIIRAKIIKQVSKQIGSLFDCDDGQNVFLLNTTKINESHSELVRLEQCLFKTLQDKQQLNSSQIGHNNEKSRPINFRLLLPHIKDLINSDQYSLFSRNMSKPVRRGCAYISIYLKYFWRKLLCKKKSA